MLLSQSTEIDKHTKASEETFEQLIHMLGLHKGLTSFPTENRGNHKQKQQQTLSPSESGHHQS